jgi:hypothetical protein
MIFFNPLRPVAAGEGGARAAGSPGAGRNATHRSGRHQVDKAGDLASLAPATVAKPVPSATPGPSGARPRFLLWTIPAAPEHRLDQTIGRGGSTGAGTPRQ